MVVRELIAKLRLKTDKGSFQRAEKNVNSVKTLMSSIAPFLTVGFATLGIRRFLSDAAQSQDTLNILQRSFKEYSDSILQWADNVDKATGRGSDVIKDLAADIGATINPLMENNAKLSSEMSMNLTSLAIDLGSFYGKADVDALNALRGGITGVTLPLKKFGIVVSTATLEEYALTQGITKSVREMNVAESTQLRYNYIMHASKSVQGDAARTADSYRNRLKSLFGRFNDVSGAIGDKLLPLFSKLFGLIHKGMTGFMKLVKGTKLIEAAFILLGIAATALGIKLFAAFLPAIIPILPYIAAVGAAILVVEDFLYFMDGSPSAIGKFIDSMFGPGSATEAAQFLKDAITFLVNYWTNTLLPSIWLLPQAIKLAMQDAINWVKSGIEVILSYFEKFGNFIGDLFGIDLGTKATEALKELGSSIFEKLGEGVSFVKDAAIEKINSAIVDVTPGSREWIRIQNERARKSMEKAQKEARTRRLETGELVPEDIIYLREQEKMKREKAEKRAQELRQKQAGIKAKKTEKIRIASEKKEEVIEMRKWAKERGYRLRIPKESITTKKTDKTINNNVDITVNTKSERPQNIAESVKRVVSEQLNNLNRKTLPAIKG